MSLKNVISDIEALLQESDERTEFINEHDPVSEDLVYNNISRTILGLVTENSPPGCPGTEFGQGLSYAVNETAERADLDKVQLYTNIVDFLREAADQIEDLSIYHNYFLEDDDE